MKKALLLSAFALAGMASVQAQTTYPVPIERRVPWTIISGTDSENRENNPLGGKTGGIADLIDRNPISFWHSNPDDCNGTSATHSHWFMIDRGVGASNVPFNMLSIQQRVQNNVANAESQSFNGAVKTADIYVTDEFIGLLGGSSNKEADDAVIYEYVNMGEHNPTLKIEVSAYTQEAQLFKFDETQTGRFVLVVITHTINPKGNGEEDESKGTADQYACLSEFNLFMDTPENRVTESNFDGNYALGENPRRTNTGRRTHSLQFSVADAVSGTANDVNTDAYRMSPLLQVTENPWIPTLNWLDWEGTYFDITNLMTVSAGNGMKFQIIADGAGNGLYKALYIDWDEDGFGEDDKIIATENTVNIGSTLEAVINVDASKAQHTYRARYIVDSQNTSPSPSGTIGADGGIVVDFKLTVEKPVTFNVNMKYEGEVVATVENVKGYANVPFIVATPDFIDVDVIAVAPESDTEVDVNLRRFVGLPFVFSSSTDDVKWQAIQQNYSYKVGQASSTDMLHNFTWTYNPDDESYLVETESPVVNTEGFSDSQLWAFVGDLFKGFVIYNKAAGFDKCLYVDGNTVKLGESTSDNVWKAYYATGRDNARYCTFKTSDDSDFLSFSNVDGNALGFNAAANNVATCWFVAPSTPMLSQVAVYKFDYKESEEPDNFPETRPVGSYRYKEGVDFSGGQGVIDAATADPYDMTKAENLRNLIDTYENNVEYVTLRTDKWYRIVSSHPADGWANYFLHSNSDNNEIIGDNIKDSRKQNYFTLFNFVPVPDVDNRYYIQSQEMFVGQCNGTDKVKQVASVNNAGQYSLVDPGTGPAKFAIKDMTQNSSSNCLHKGGKEVCSLSGWAYDSGGSNFYILPADDVEVNLTEEINGVGHVDFVHFPFPVTTTDDGSELYIIYAGYDNSGETSVPVVSYEKVNEVAANTPFMVLNQDKTLVSLKINTESIALMAETDEAEAKTNVMAGTIRTKNAEAGDFVIGHDENGALEFQKSADVPSVKSNYVYIPAANLGDVHSAASALPLNDPTTTDTTGISEVVEGAKGVKAVYDLQGRKLAAPAKGINIVNGKKVLVK